MKESEISYIAGLFDGEGSIHYKQAPEKKKKHRGKPGYRVSNSWRINMEVTMTDPMVIHWLRETLKVGTVTKSRVKDFVKMALNILCNIDGDVLLEKRIMYAV